MKEPKILIKSIIMNKLIIKVQEAIRKIIDKINKVII